MLLILYIRSFCLIKNIFYDSSLYVLRIICTIFLSVALNHNIILCEWNKQSYQTEIVGRLCRIHIISLAATVIQSVDQGCSYLVLHYSSIVNIARVLKIFSRNPRRFLVVEYRANFPNAEV